ncbi:MAG: DUF3810 family protein [Saprospiraceae bacterium]|uniref:DUF3810 family protein n=1 Tax=Candidatus Opimibacter skivensis TaxID=2982028 RepID=A0A9D7T0R2_9BACT|nr:DUF3810 family protein [Candidatus Opimibacter skivensis]
MDKSSKSYIIFKKLHSRSLVWIGLALIAIFLSDILHSSFVDRFYYQGIFEWIRIAYDTLLGWSPIPMLYIVVAIILVRIIFWMRSRKKGMLYLITKAIGGIAFLIFIFYFAWGFNYNQTSLQKRLGYNLKDVTQQDIEVEYQRATLELQKAAEELPSLLKTDESISALKISDNDLRPDVEKALAELGIPNKGRVRVRQIWPPGLLLRWSTAGIYIPQAFEGHIDDGLLSVQKPFTIAHEMAHGYGVTDEGACNFIAWLACIESKNPWVRFGGAFTYWRYAASEMPGDSIEQELKIISPVVLRSLSLIRKNDEKYPDLLPKIRDAIYSNYLKHHGVEGGLRSYNYVVMMVVEYLRKKG